MRKIKPVFKALITCGAKHFAVNNFHLITLCNFINNLIFSTADSICCFQGQTLVPVIIRRRHQIESQVTTVVFCYFYHINQVCFFVCIVLYYCRFFFYVSKLSVFFLLHRRVTLPPHVIESLSKRISQ